MRLAVLLALVLVGTTGCAAFTDDARADGRVTVAAAFYPLAFVAQRVGGDDVSVTNLTQPGAEPHDLELTIKETAEIADADLVMLLHGFQPAVDDAVEQVAAGEVLDVADVVDLETSEEHADDHGDEAGDHGDEDPHFWQDPLLMAEVGDAVAEDLAEIDPAHAADYRANAADLRTDLEALDAAYADGLASCQHETLVVSHDAFGYLGRRYGLDVVGINGLSPDAEPSPAHIRALQDLIRKDGIRVVFSEQLASREFADSLAHDLHIRAEVLDPIEGLSDATAGQDYLSLMRRNLATMRESNQCT